MSAARLALATAIEMRASKSAELRLEEPETLLGACGLTGTKNQQAGNMTKKLKLSVVIVSVISVLFIVIGGLRVRAAGNNDGAYRQLVVDEGLQLFAGDALRVRRPGAPLILLRDRRTIIVPGEFEFLILIVDDLEEEHPAQLADALRVAIHANILAHDVLNGFNCGSNDHGSGDLLIEHGLHCMDGGDELVLPRNTEW